MGVPHLPFHCAVGFGEIEVAFPEPAIPVNPCASASNGSNALKLNDLLHSDALISRASDVNMSLRLDLLNGAS